jgi:hypothetical protein
MVRKLRIAAVCCLVAIALIAAALWGAYVASRQVRPFYQQALQLDPGALERGRQEMESRASALYTDAQQAGKWHALFTDEQINGWLAVQLADQAAPESEPPLAAVRDPRIDISADLLTLGFKATQRGVESVISVDASVFVTEEGDVAVRLLNVRAGALPLPVAMVADRIAAACQQLSLPVLWIRQDDCPVAMIKIRNEEASDGRQFHLDAIELTDGELYVAGHTVLTAPVDANTGIELDKYELRLSPRDKGAMLEITRRPTDGGQQDAR